MCRVTPFENPSKKPGSHSPQEMMRNRALHKRYPNLKTYSNFSSNCHLTSGLPLFDWRVVVLQPPITHAGLHLTRRYRIHPSIADVVASLAGLGRDGEVA